ncbi:hypothetical protein L6R53_24875 [Myxococcota bacterium]|nr:hypothetical protein [Myxococcota bacterium]
MQRERSHGRSLSRVRGLLPLALAVLVGCRDPAAPPALPGPADLPRWSTAPWVRWAGLDEPLRGPLLVVVDAPGGPMDRLLADPDVTTFVNDRFTPLFLIPSAAPTLPHPSVQVLDAGGCWLLPPQAPADPAAMVAALNGVMRDQAAGAPPTTRLEVPVRFGVPVPPEHPLRRPCPPR